MDFWMLILCVIPIIVTPITISPNGNSPERKMLGGMVIDAHRTAASKPEVTVIKAPILKGNSSILAINERYRRLIPYMTFYYANDLVTPTTESHKTNVEVEKAEIIEAGTVRPNGREARVIYTPQRPNNIPRYHGNRLTPINIASSNPTKLYYKEVPTTYHSPQKSNPTHHSVPEYSVSSDLHNNREIFYDRYVQTQIKAPSTPFTASNRKPYLQFHENAEHANIQYYSPEQVEAPRYKLVPYEQTPPVKVVNVESAKKHYNPVELVPKDPIYIKPRPYLRPQQFTVYDNPYNQQLKTRKPSTTISEMYYERRPSVPVQPVVENGFKPIVNPILTTEAPLYTSKLKEESYQTIKSQVSPVPETFAPDQNKYRQEYVVDPVYASGKPALQEAPDTVSLADLLNSLQINKAIPKPITRENVGASIRTLLQVLSTLNAQTQQNEVETAAVLSSPKPFEAPEVSIQSTPVPVLTTTSKPQHVEFQEEPYLAPVHTPSQHLDEYPSSGSSSQRFPLPVTSDNEGGTPGLPGVDYPILTVIPTTKFDCKTQRYKGFFADPETRCQVWHYCDLNGGQASFLCPNGTIFSQAALTCDWWFNVRCASTTQLYVLNESLYKYILPHSPKFPEDYSGPLVDKYLSLKFKEMEEQFKKNKKKKVASDKIDTDECTEKDSSSEGNASVEVAESAVNRGNVIVESPGSSGNVQRLQDE